MTIPCQIILDDDRRPGDDLATNETIHLKVISGPPVIVQYDLTGYSHSLTSVLDALYDWGSQHKLEVKKRFKVEIPDAV